MKKIYADLLKIKDLCEYAHHCQSASDNLALDGMTTYFLESRMYENVMFRILLAVDDCLDELPDDIKDE